MTILIPALQNNDFFVHYKNLDTQLCELYDELGIGTEMQRKRASDIPDSYFEKEFNESFGKDKFFVFAFVDGVPAGYISGSVRENTPVYGIERVGFVDAICVDRAFQHQGIGKELLTSFYAWLKERGVTICHLEVKIKNKNAVGAYEKLGYEADEQRMWVRIP